jgi:hypothetical protein
MKKGDIIEGEGGKMKGVVGGGGGGVVKQRRRQKISKITFFTMRK